MTSKRGFDSTTIGVALSGGGVRAALFSVGALIAVAEYARQRGKGLQISSVSGSALMVLEVAWSKAETDVEALLEAANRIACKAYWLSKGVLTSLGFTLLYSAVAYAGHFYSGTAFASAAWGWLFILALIAVFAIILFRTQGVWFRGVSISSSNAKSRQKIYGARASDFPSNDSRRVKLDSISFGATALNSGRPAHFDRVTRRNEAAVSHYAQASAAFPGAFFPVALGEDRYLYVDGGVADNTGLSYFQDAPEVPDFLISVDSSLNEDAQRRPPYWQLSVSFEKAWWYALLLFASLIVGGALGSLLSKEKTGFILGWIAYLTPILIFLLLVAMFSSGVIKDLRIIGGGWPATLIQASELRRKLVNYEWSAVGMRVENVLLRDGFAKTPWTWPAPKTQLWRFPARPSQELVRRGYVQTCEVLGMTQDSAVLEGIKRVGARSWRSVGSLIL